MYTISMDVCIYVLATHTHINYARTANKILQSWTWKTTNKLSTFSN